MARMKKYNDFSEDHIKKLGDLKKSWQDFEDQHPWEFNYFWDKIATYYNNWQDRYKGKDELEYEIQLESYGDAPSLPNAKNDADWRKRNGCIQVKANTGGYSGGSCWDDENSYARPYYTGTSVDYVDLENFLEHILVSIFGRNHAFADIPKLLEELRNSSIIHEDSNTSYEYYGNSDDYQWYEVKLWDLYQFLAKQGAF
jgi:hypothetical protein